MEKTQPTPDLPDCGQGNCNQMEGQIPGQNLGNATLYQKRARISREIKSMIDIHRSPSPSSLWRYAGLDPSHPIGFNHRLKALVLGELATILMHDPDYFSLYRRYRRRVHHRPGLTTTHLHKMSIRYMVKQYLKDLHIEWRKSLHLPVPKKYDSNI